MDAAKAERACLLDQSGIDLEQIARELHALCYEAWTAEPSRVAAVVELFDDVCRHSDSPIVTAHAEWSRGIRALVEGKLDESISLLDRSRYLFLNAADAHEAANTQTAKLYALALLGRYDEAVSVGLSAREVFLEHGDQYAAGKIEHNIGNLYWRRDMYREAGPYLASAHERFDEIGDQRQLAMVENSQAFVCTLQNDLSGAERLYKSALDRAESSGFTVTAAEIEVGLSNMYLFEGRYDAALAHLESARGAYEKLGLETQSFGCRLEIADIYREIGLVPEAIAAYHASGEYFEKAGIRAELARCLLGEARALIRPGETAAAGTLLERAGGLYRSENNDVAYGAVCLAQAEALRAAGANSEAAQSARFALDIFERSGNDRLSLFARWLAADIAAGSSPETAITELQALLARAAGRPGDIEFLCHVSLGRLTKSVTELTAAVEIIESSRAALAADELRMAFFAARLVPYTELTKIELQTGNAEKAFIWHERSRARVLADMLEASGPAPESDGTLESLRQKINWLNNRIQRTDAMSEEGRLGIRDMQSSLRGVERDYDERLRQVRAHQSAATADHTLDIAHLMHQLGGGTLVEYAIIDDQLCAFLVTSAGVRVVSDLATAADLTDEVRRFLFQMNTGRIAAQMSDRSRQAARDRLTHRSRRLHEVLIAPLDIKTSKLVIVPSSALHQLPFGALQNSDAYLAEQYLISYAPSAVLLQQILKQPPTQPKRAVIVAVPDTRTPMIVEEAATAAEHFPDAVMLSGEDATLDNLIHTAANADIVHLACHGRFRRDNPAFCSLQLADTVSVRDLRALNLKSSIMVLSACESGLNATDAADDLVGLTSAFFAAGAATLVMSLWRVDDAAALGLMKTFYSRLSAGRTPAEAMADAQRSAIAAGIHPFLWSQFVVSGRG